MKTVNLFIKRFFDIVGSFILLIVLLPVLLVIFILVKITSKGPAFFKQERLGKDGKVFQIIKFRTMVVDAEKKGDGLFIYDPADKRITGIGRILRKTSMDELPQLFNVIKSEMSLIGPRPPVTYHPYTIEEYDEYKIRRFQVKPGITGLAQVRLRNGGTWDERIEYDIKYVDNWSLLLDVRILLETLIVVLKQKNIMYTDASKKRSM